MLSNAGITYQIDASTLSSVSAGKIIIGNDDGVGVRIQGDVASASDGIDADGTQTISSNPSSERDTTITTGGTAASGGSGTTMRIVTKTMTTGAVTTALQASRRLTSMLMVT